MEPKKTCKVCSVTLTKPFICSKCKKARYCGKDCQNKDWREGHKLECFASSIAVPEPQVSKRMDDFEIIRKIGEGNFSVSTFPKSH